MNQQRIPQRRSRLGTQQLQRMHHLNCQHWNLLFLRIMTRKCQRLSPLYHRVKLKTCWYASVAQCAQHGRPVQTHQICSVMQCLHATQALARAYWLSPLQIAHHQTQELGVLCRVRRSTATMLWTDTATMYALVCCCCCAQCFLLVACQHGMVAMHTCLLSIGDHWGRP